MSFIQIFLGSESIIKNLKTQQTHTFIRKGSLFLELHLSFLQVTYLANAHTYDIYLFHMRILIAHKEITQYLVTFTLSVVNTSTQTYTHYEKYSNLKYISETTILPLIIKFHFISFTYEVTSLTLSTEMQKEMRVEVCLTQISNYPQFLFGPNSNFYKICGSGKKKLFLCGHEYHFECSYELA